MPHADDEADAAFTAEDALTVARHLQASPSMVLVGGQSLNFWAEQFRAATPDLDRLAPFQSRDIDFLGTVADVEACARRMGGKAMFPGPDHVNTPEVGVVACEVNGKKLRIDFLGNLAGLKSSDVRRAAISAEVGGVILRVMHPLDIVKSRCANIMVLGRRDPLALRQMRASLHIATAYIRQAAAHDLRLALDLIEETFAIACSKNGVGLWHAFAIDIFDAISPCEGLPERFTTTRLPRMKDFLRQKRAKPTARSRR